MIKRAVHYSLSEWINVGSLSQPAFAYEKDRSKQSACVMAFKRLSFSVVKGTFIVGGLAAGLTAGSELAGYVNQDSPYWTVYLFGLREYTQFSNPSGTSRVYETKKECSDDF